MLFRSLWKKNAFSILVKNFHRASSNCSPKKDITCPSSKIEISTIGNFSKFFFQKLPQNLAAWQKETQTFFDTYAKEQLRLAALFPKISSEILPLHPDEILGDKLKDRSFLLTFDDGPTEKEGSTDRLAQKLRDLGIHAFFFSLGSELEKRKQSNGWESLRDLYSSHCLASHGKIHSPHPKLSNWKESLDFTLLKIKEVQAQNPTKSKQIYFRPPFGQRTAEISAYSKENKSPVILWNIDTQDWNPMIRAEAAWGRLQKLMLVWRKGIVLFHDVHPKAEKILPSIEQFMQTNGLIFADCRDY